MKNPTYKFIVRLFAVYIFLQIAFVLNYTISQLFSSARIFEISISEYLFSDPYILTLFIPAFILLFIGIWVWNIPSSLLPKESDIIDSNYSNIEFSAIKIIGVYFLFNSLPIVIATLIFLGTANLVNEDLSLNIRKDFVIAIIKAAFALLFLFKTEWIQKRLWPHTQ